MNEDFAKSMWRGFMCTQNREQADAWYDRLTDAEKDILHESPLAIMVLARKGQETMSTYEQYQAGYISREKWAEKDVAPLMQQAEAKARRKLTLLDGLIFGGIGALIVTEIVRVILW